MAPDDQVKASASAAARRRGNNFYKTRNFERGMHACRCSQDALSLITDWLPLPAIEAYQQAAVLSPTDPAPLSNLSAVSFETGRYLDAINFIKQALDLSESVSDQEPKKQKLYARLVKSLLLTNSSQEAEAVLPRLHDTFSAEGFSKETLQTNAGQMKELQTFVADTSRLRSQILDRLPRYKPYM